MSTLYVNAGLVPTQNRFPDTIKTRGLSAMSPAASLSFQQDPSLTLLGSHKLNSSCGPKGRSPKVSNLETSMAMELTQMSYPSKIIRKVRNFPRDLKFFRFDISNTMTS